MILEQLRTHTAAAHQALEEEVRIEEAVRDLESYRRLLERFFGFHHAFEARIGALQSWEGTGYDPHARLKSPWLREDLRQLGLSDEEILRLPLCTELPEMRTLAQGFGCAYVIEGSTLGGRHISRLLDADSKRDFPKRFFQSYGEEVGPKWKEFCASLEQFANTCPDTRPEVVQAAEETFACFRQWMR